MERGRYGITKRLYIIPKNSKDVDLSSKSLIFLSSYKFHKRALEANFQRIPTLSFRLQPPKDSNNQPSTLLGRQMCTSNKARSFQPHLAKGQIRKKMVYRFLTTQAHGTDRSSKNKRRIPSLEPFVCIKTSMSQQPKERKIFTDPTKIEWQSSRFTNIVEEAEWEWLSLIKINIYFISIHWSCVHWLCETFRPLSSTPLNLFKELKNGSFMF